MGRSCRDESQPQSYSPIFKALCRLKNLQASSEWVATYLSISSRHSPLWFHFASNKSQTALQTKSCSSPQPAPALSTLAAEADRGLMLFSSLLCSQHTLDLLSFPISKHSLRETWSILQAPLLVWLCLQSELMLPTEQPETAWAHSPHCTADSAQITPSQLVTREGVRWKLKFMPLWTLLISRLQRACA